MKNRDDVTERRKGKGRQRQALIAGWQTSKARKESAGLRWHTKRGKLHQQPLQCVGAWWAAGGGCCRYRRRTFNLHSLLSLGGVQPHHAPTFITRRSSLGGWGGVALATWTWGVVQNKPAAAKIGKGEGRERSWSFTYNNQDKQNTAAGWLGGGEQRRAYILHMNDGTCQKTWHAGRARTL